MSMVDQQYSCSFCNKSFRYQTLLQRHMHCHTGEKPYVCVLCHQTFTQKSNLEKHVRIHTGERPFQCHFCHRSFTQKSNVDRHMRTHTGERPYSCHLCNRCFSQKSNVERHMKVHSELNPEILDNNIYSSETVLNQNSKDVFDKITNSLKLDYDNVISVKSSTKTLLHNNISKDIENFISPIMILDNTDKILSYQDQNVKNGILSQSDMPCMKEITTPLYIKTNTSTNDFYMKESDPKIFASDSDLAKDKSSLVKNVYSEKNNCIINEHCIEMKPSPCQRLFWKKSKQRNSIAQLQKSHFRKPSLQKNQSVTTKKYPCIASGYLTGKNSSTKLIPEIKCQMSNSYQQIIGKSDENTENMDQPILDYIENGLSNIKGACGAIEKNKAPKAQQDLLKDKKELQIKKEEPESIMFKCKDAFEMTNVINTSIKQVSSSVQVDNDYHCPICMKTFAHKCNIGKHMLLHAGIKPYRCIMCSKAFSQKCNAQRHMKTHANDYQQQVEPERSENISLLEKYKMKDSTEIHSKRELEKINGKNCNDLKSIPNPVLKESTELGEYNLYLKEFTNNENISSSKDSRHRKSFKCASCFAVFLKLTDLSEHVLVHKEKYFDNNLSPSTKDVNSESLDNKIFTDIKPFNADLLSCEYCGNKFLDQWELSKHEELCHLENKAYTCKPCQSIILGTREYLTHLKKFHKKQIPSCAC